MLPFSIDLNRPVPSSSISLDTPVHQSQSQFEADWSKLYVIPGQVKMGYSARQSMFDDIRLFGSLHHGWLGPGSQKIPSEITERVSTVARQLEQIDALPNPELTPNANGTISLEWESSRGEVYIEFGKTRISGFLRVEDSPTVYFKDVSSLQPSFYAEIRDLLYPPTQTYSITIPGAVFDSYALQ